MKLKTLAGAVLLAAAAPSFASIDLPSTGNSELVFVIRDNTAGTQISYALDLGITMTSFLADGQQAAGYHREWNLTGSDLNFTSFLSQTNPSSYDWAVIGGDTTGGTAAGGVRWFTTAAAGVAQATVATMTNGQIGTGLPLLGSFFTAVNQSGTHPTQPNGSSVNNINDSGLGYYGEPGGTGPNLNGNAPFSNANAVGASSSFYALARSGAAVGSAVAVDPFNNAAGLGLFSLIQTGADSYQLGYTLAAVPVAEVPEPGGLALLLAGFTAMGFVGRRRSGR